MSWTECAQAGLVSEPSLSMHWTVTRGAGLQNGGPLGSCCEQVSTCQTTARSTSSPKPGTAFTFFWRETPKMWRMYIENIVKSTFIKNRDDYEQQPQPCVKGSLCARVSASHFICIFYWLPQAPRQGALMLILTGEEARPLCKAAELCGVWDTAVPLAPGAAPSRSHPAYPHFPQPACWYSWRHKSRCGGAHTWGVGHPLVWPWDGGLLALVLGHTHSGKKPPDFQSLPFSQSSLLLASQELLDWLKLDITSENTFYTIKHHTGIRDSLVIIILGPVSWNGATHWSLSCPASLCGSKPEAAKEKTWKGKNRET